MRNAALLLSVIIAIMLAACNDNSQPPPPAAATPDTSSPPNGATADGAPSNGAATAQERQEPTPASPAPAPPRLPFDPASFRLELEPVTGGLAQPVLVTHAGDGSGRLFVVERRGTIRVIAGGAVLPQPFLDVRSLVRAAGLEQGLLGLAFHPRFAENGRFFAAYTANNSTADNTVAEYRVSSDPNRADPDTGRVLLAIPDFASNHNGGMLAFGPDGYLYVSTGDGGGGGDPQRNGQKLTTLLGKILRLDVDGGESYVIPPGNPFVGRPDARPEIWAYGLRNPWRAGFDRLTGDLWIADAGQNAWEEIDFQPAGSRGGENYGWNIMEGAHCYPSRSGCDPTGLVLPVAEYSDSLGCAVIGGYVYRGAAYPALWGAYFHGDYCSGRIWAIYETPDGAWQHVELLRTEVQASAFGEDEAGEIYLAGFSTGVIYRLTAAPR